MVQALAVDAHDAAVDVGAAPDAGCVAVELDRDRAGAPLRRTEHEVGVLADDRGVDRGARAGGRGDRSSCQVPESAKWLVASPDGVA